jgi:hypothetical protein
MLITEPITTLTDYAIAVESLVFGVVLLRRGAARRQRSPQLWGAAFGSVALAAGLGGTCHGFALALGDAIVAGLWQGMVYALSFASFFMLLAAIKSSLPYRYQRWGFWGVGVKSALFLGWTIRQYSADQVFSFGVADYLSSMLMVLALAIVPILADQPVLTYQFAADTKRAMGWIIAGVLASGIAIALQRSDVRLAELLNHNDFYHLVQMLALYLFFQGSRLLKDA